MKIMQPLDSIEIPVSHLDTSHVLYCSDLMYRKVERIDYVYDIDGSMMSKEYAIAYCEGGHRQLVRGHVYVYTGIQKEPLQEVNSKPPEKKKRKLRESGSVPPDDVA